MWSSYQESWSLLDNIYLRSTPVPWPSSKKTDKSTAWVLLPLITDLKSHIWFSISYYIASVYMEELYWEVVMVVDKLLHTFRSFKDLCFWRTTLFSKCLMHSWEVMILLCPFHFLASFVVSCFSFSFQPYLLPVENDTSSSQDSDYLEVEHTWFLLHTVLFKIL